MDNKNVNSNAISKALIVMRAFTDIQNEWGVNELARHLKFPVSSLHRIMTILKNEQLLEISSETGKYKIGLELIRISSIVSNKLEYKEIAKPYMQLVSDAFNKSVYLSIYHPQEKKMSFIDRVNSTNTIQYVLEIGVLHPLYKAASGKIILAFLPQKEIDDLLNKNILDDTERKRLQEEIRLFQEQGFALTRNERNVDSVGIAAPIFNASQKVIGSMTCVIPEPASNTELNQQIALKVIQEAKNISHNLGFLP